jgi:hypothetical protein
LSCLCHALRLKEIGIEDEENYLITVGQYFSAWFYQAFRIVTITDSENKKMNLGKKANASHAPPSEDRQPLLTGNTGGK